MEESTVHVYRPHPHHEFARRVDASATVADQRIVFPGEATSNRYSLPNSATTRSITTHGRQVKFG